MKVSWFLPTALSTLLLSSTARAEGVTTLACSDVKSQVQVVSAGPVGDGFKAVLHNVGTDPLTVWCIVETHSSNGKKDVTTTLTHFWKPGDRDVTCMHNMHFSNGRWYALVGRTNDLMKSVPMQERTACGEQAWKLVAEKEAELKGP